MLETDRKNSREYVELCLRASLIHYHALVREGYNPLCARCAAISYMRRKTGLSWPLAAGYFDMQEKSQ